MRLCCARCGGPVWLDVYLREWHCYWCAWTARPEATVLALIDRERLVDRRVGLCDGCGVTGILWTRGTASGHTHLCCSCYEMAEMASEGRAVAG